MYRPQFAYSTPAGCRDEDFVYYFDGSNTPLLNQNLQGLTVSNIPLVMQQDAPFYWRGVKLGVQGGGGAGAFPDLTVQFQDPYQNNLSDDLVSALQYGFPQNPDSTANGRLLGPPVPLEPEIYCPPGSYILLFLKASNASLQMLRVSLYGVKRFKECS